MKGSPEQVSVHVAASHATPSGNLYVELQFHDQPDQPRCLTRLSTIIRESDGLARDGKTFYMKTWGENEGEGEGVCGQGSSAPRLPAGASGRVHTYLLQRPCLHRAR